MPRKAQHGGAREGTPGQVYGNRSDLNAPKVLQFRGQPYGERTAQEALQKATPPTPPAAPVPQQPAELSGPHPGELGDLFGPTARPDEPITHGMPFGPGPGPTPGQPTGDPDMDQLRAAYRATQSPAILAILRQLSEG